MAMDAGEIDGRFFVNIAGIGVDAYVASQFSLARRRGFLGYIGITARALVTYVPTHYRITSGGTTVETRAILVTIANSAQFGNGARIAPGARVDDGLLDLVVLEEHSRLVTLWNLPRLFNGTVDRAPGCSIRRLDRATIESDQPMIFHVDGEPVAGGTSLRVRIHPGALNVCV